MTAALTPRLTGTSDVPVGRGRLVGRAAVEFLPAFVVALLILPFVISQGHFWPWRPSTIDLQVYVYTVHDLLVGKDIYATRTPGWNLPFIYPPIAALLMIPTAFGPYALWQVVWTAALIWAQNAVLKRCGVGRGGQLALISTLSVLVVEPLRTTLGYGQVNTLLMAFVFIDLVPVRRLAQRRLPHGILIGLAAAVKLTPALFGFLALGARRARVFAIAVLTFLLLTGLGVVILTASSAHFFGGLAHGDTGAPSSPIYVGNQALTGVVTRLAHADTHALVITGIGLSAIVAVLGLVVASHWWRRGEQVFAVALVGMTTCLVSPLSWTHHYVWVLPLGISVLLRNRLPRWGRVVAVVWAGWVALCPMLMVLPYGGVPERHYNAGQELIANLGPVLGVVLIAGLALNLLRQPLNCVGQTRCTPGSSAAKRELSVTFGQVPEARGRRQR